MHLWHKSTFCNTPFEINQKQLISPWRLLVGFLLLCLCSCVLIFFTKLYTSLKLNFSKFSAHFYCVLQNVNGMCFKLKKFIMMSINITCILQNHMKVIFIVISFFFYSLSLNFPVFLSHVPTFSTTLMTFHILYQVKISYPEDVVSSLKCHLRVKLGKQCLLLSNSR